LLFTALYRDQQASLNVVKLEYITIQGKRQYS